MTKTTITLTKDGKFEVTVEEIPTQIIKVSKTPVGGGSTLNELRLCMATAQWAGSTVDVVLG